MTTNPPVLLIVLYGCLLISEPQLSILANVSVVVVVVVVLMTYLNISAGGVDSRGEVCTCIYELVFYFWTNNRHSQQWCMRISVSAWSCCSGRCVSVVCPDDTVGVYDLLPHFTFQHFLCSFSTGFPCCFPSLMLFHLECLLILVPECFSPWVFILVGVAVFTWRVCADHRGVWLWR